MKLELKHLVNYLPYGLLINNGTKMTCEGFGVEGVTSIQQVLNFNHLNEFKPLLKPIDIKDFTSRDYTYNEWSFFFENHYDVFSLIDKGLAIEKK